MAKKNEKKINVRNGFYGELIEVEFPERIKFYKAQILKTTMWMNYILPIEVETNKFTFFIPKFVSQTFRDDFIQNIHELGGKIDETRIQHNEANRKMLLEQISKQITSRLAEIEEAQNKAIVFSRRSTKLKNVTKALLFLRDFSNEYAKMFQFRSTKLNERIEKDIEYVNQVTQEMFHHQ